MVASARRRRPVPVASLSAIFDHRPDGVIYARSPKRLGAYPNRLTDCLEHWAKREPARIFLAERGTGGEWCTVAYGEAFDRVRKLASGLLAAGLSSDRPLAILSGNSIDHGLLALAAMYVGVPYAPVAPAYSLAVKEYVALSHLLQNLSPAMVFVGDGEAYNRALKTAVGSETKILYGCRAPEGIVGHPAKLDIQGLVF